VTAVAPRVARWMGGRVSAKVAGRLKRFMRTLVTSAAIGQSSRVTPTDWRRIRPNGCMSARPPDPARRRNACATSVVRGRPVVERRGGPSVECRSRRGCGKDGRLPPASNTVQLTSPYSGQRRCTSQPVHVLEAHGGPAPDNDVDAPSRKTCTVRRERAPTRPPDLLLMRRSSWSGRVPGPSGR